MARSWLGRYSQAATVDSFEDGVSTAGQEGGAGFIAEFFGISAVAGVAKEFGAVRISDDRFQVQLAVFHFGESADGNLAAAAEAVQESALTGGRGAGVIVV